MADRKSVTVVIAGQDYVLKGDNSGNYLMSLANDIDTRIREIKIQNPNYTSSKAATLLAIQLQDEINHIREDYDKLIGELNRLRL